MTRAHLIKKGNKEYIVFTCDVCGRTNVFDKEHFMFSYKYGKQIFCKFCGSQNDFSFDEKVERRLKLWGKKRMRSKSNAK